MMWRMKRFKSAAEQEAWIVANDREFQIVTIFINNGYAVEFKKLRKVG